VNATPAERQKATEAFQAIADAYYVLSDTTRRREYDRIYASQRSRDKTEEPSASSSFFSQFSSMFGNSAGSEAEFTEQRPNADGVFADVFDDVSLHHSTTVLLTCHVSSFAPRLRE
jgi:curved DNA-binding protein CbpA